MDEAACSGMAPRSGKGDDLFFPERGRSDLRAKAQAICATCPVVPECEDYRDRTESTYGIWGGKVTQRNKKAAS